MKIRNYIRDCSFPILLSGIVDISIAYVFVREDELTMFIGVSLLMNIVLFAAYFALNCLKNTVFKAIGFLAMFAAIIFVCSNIHFTETSVRKSMMSWFLEPEIISWQYTDYMLTVILLLGFILSAAVFYFSVVRYRSFALFLICVIPFALFAKTFTDVALPLPVLVMTFYFLVMIQQRQKQHLNADFGGGSLIPSLVIIAFVGGVATLAAFLPKVEITPYREVFDEFITGMEIEAAKSVIDFTDSSSDGGNPANSNDAIFTLVNLKDAEIPIYMRLQVFDLPMLTDNGDGITDEYWDRTYETVMTAYQEGFQTKYSYDDAVSAVRKLVSICARNNYSDEFLMMNNELESIESGVSQMSSVMVISEFSEDVSALIAPLNVTDLQFANPNYDGIIITGAESSGILTTMYRNRAESGYTLEYYTKPKNKDFLDWCAQYMSMVMDFVENAADAEFVDEIKELLSSEEKDALQSFYNEYISAAEYNERVSGTLYDTSDIAALAEEITADCITDYDKAKAIENYFSNANFIYDNSYLPDDDSTDYFLFTSKRGSCSDYTSAMVLMARAVGLTARYCEGYLASEYNGSEIVIRAKDAHAFPEVYIDGYGWMTFEPTVSMSSGGSYYESDFIKILLIIVSAIVAMLLILWLFVKLKPRLSEAVFSAKARKAVGTAQTILLYPQISRMIRKAENIGANTLCAAEIAEIAQNKYNTDISAICELYNSGCYGGKSAANGDCFDVYVRLKKSMALNKKARKQ